MNPEFELSIVIPTLNEANTIPGIVDNLSVQKGVQFELIISDGGSTDSTCETATKSHPAVSIVTGKAGRATQLNRGAAAAKGEFILFLHADCTFSDNYALRSALDALRSKHPGTDEKFSAGHFCLKFKRTINTPSLSYSFLEAKARQRREGCSHGDQGILINAGHFSLTEGFDESCQILAETRFADRLRQRGEWLLLPVEIMTSARRFEQEGMKERQALNAIIMALAFACRDDILARMPDLYRPGPQAAKPDIRQLFTRITAMIFALPDKEQPDFWKNIGIYLCKNAWQIALFLDELKRFSGMDAGKDCGNRFLALYERHLEKMLNSRIAVTLAATASRVCSKAFSL